MGYVPSEETLKELGLTRLRSKHLWRTLYTPQVFYEERKGEFSIDYYDEEWDSSIPIYPKSDEELRLLISMMTP